MKKLLENKKILGCIFCIAIIVSISARQAMWPNQLDQDAKNNCIQFQMQDGGNRLAEANWICNYLKEDDLYEIDIGAVQHKAANQFIIKKYNMADMIKIFGTPTQKNKDGSLLYNITSNCTIGILINKLHNGVQITIN